MKKIKKLLVGTFLIVAVLVVSFNFVGCDKNPGDEESTLTLQNVLYAVSKVNSSFESENSVVGSAPDVSKSKTIENTSRLFDDSLYKTGTASDYESYVYGGGGTSAFIDQYYDFFFEAFLKYSVTYNDQFKLNQKFVSYAQINGSGSVSVNDSATAYGYCHILENKFIIVDFYGFDILSNEEAPIAIRFAINYDFTANNYQLICIMQRSYGGSNFNMYFSLTYKNDQFTELKFLNMEKDEEIVYLYMVYDIDIANNKYFGGIPDDWAHISVGNEDYIVPQEKIDDLYEEYVHYSGLETLREDLEITFEEELTA